MNNSVNPRAVITRFAFRLRRWLMVVNHSSLDVGDKRYWLSRRAIGIRAVYSKVNRFEGKRICLFNNERVSDLQVLFASIESLAGEQRRVNGARSTMLSY